MIKLISLTSLILGLSACSSSSIKDKINQTGDVAGQVAGEFIEGASKGVAKAFDVKVELPQGLTDKGIEFGKASVTSDSLGTDNLLVLYVIFNKDFEGTLTAKAFDDQSLEMGRATVTVNGKMNDAKYLEFHFDRLTNIDSKNKLTVE
jgi:hypothetical protein